MVHTPAAKKTPIASGIPTRVTNSIPPTTHQRKRKPKGPDLPAKVRLEEGASRLTPLYVVDNYSNDRWHAKDERTDNGRGGRHADQKAQGVQGIHEVCNGDEAWCRLSGGDFGFVGHERWLQHFRQMRSPFGNGKSTQSTRGSFSARYRSAVWTRGEVTLSMTSHPPGTRRGTTCS
jgi:hypothetical protein